MTNYSPIIAVAEIGKKDIHIVKTEGQSKDQIKKVSDIHKGVVVAIMFNAVVGVVISFDDKGLIEYWNPDTY